MAEFNPDNGYSFGISISDFKLDSLRMRISLLIDNYNGGFKTSYGGLGGSSITEAKVSKATMGIGVYPFNISIRVRLHFSFGGELSFKLSDQTSGYKSYWMMGSQSKYITIENDSVTINKNIFFGISGRINYDIRMKKNWYISPQYKFYFGLTDEFENTEVKMKSFRNCLLIGIVRKMN